MCIVYILYSSKLDRFYIGFTENLELRLKFHEQGADQRKFTYNSDDWELYFKIECESKAQGLAIEKHIKSMKSKVYIQNLCKYAEMTEKLLLKYSNC